MPQPSPVASSPPPRTAAESAPGYGGFASARRCTSATRSATAARTPSSAPTGSGCPSPSGTPPSKAPAKASSISPGGRPNRRINPPKQSLGRGVSTHRPIRAGRGRTSRVVTTSQLRDVNQARAPRRGALSQPVRSDRQIRGAARLCNACVSRSRASVRRDLGIVMASEGDADLGRRRAVATDLVPADGTISEPGSSGQFRNSPPLCWACPAGPGLALGSCADVFFTGG